MAAQFHITGPVRFWVRFPRFDITNNRTSEVPVRTVSGGPSDILIKVRNLSTKQNQIIRQDPSLLSIPQSPSVFDTTFGNIGSGLLQGAVSGAESAGLVSFGNVATAGIIGSVSAVLPPQSLTEAGVGAGIAGGLGNQNDIRFLGTAEVSPRVQIQDFTRPIFTDAGGSVVPTEIAYQSKRAVIIADLNRFDYSTYIRMENAPRHVAAGRKAFDSRLDIGRLMLKYMFELWIQFTYHDTNNSVGTDMPAGYYFPRCWLEGPTTDEIGARVERIRVVWSAYRLHTKEHSWLLYSQADEDFSQLPRENIA